MNRSEATLEELFSLLPELEELELLRVTLVGAAVPNPDKAWDSSSSYATFDKRIVSQEQLEKAVNESADALVQYVASLRSALHSVFRSFWSGDDGTTAAALVSWGERLESAGLYRKARQCYDVALSLSLPLPDKTPQILALRRIARVASALGDLQEAWSYYQRSAELARDTGDVRSEVVARTGLGNVRLWQGRPAEAERCYRDVQELLASLDAPSGLQLERAQLYNNLGNVATRQGRLDEAEEWFQRGLQIWENELSSPYDQAVCYHNQALLRGVQERREEARDIYRKALSLEIPAGVWAVIAIDLAELFLRDGHVSQAEEWGRAAEERAIATRSPYFLGRTYHGRGNIARAIGDDGGFIFFEKALQIAREKGYRLLEGETLVDYALLKIQNGETEEAQAYLEHAREIFIDLGTTQDQERAEQALRDIAGPGPEEIPILAR